MTDKEVLLSMKEGKVSELNQLQDELGLSTKKDLFNHALSFFEWAVREIKAGRSIASVDKDGAVKEVTMSAFSSIETIAD